MLDFFISTAQAAPAGEPSPLMTFAPLIVLFVVFYFLLIRPQQKRAKEHKQMVAALSRGDEVVTSGGVLGRITEVGENFITIEVAAGSSMQVQSHAITQIMPKGTFKS